jgi:hypothetical protein
MEYTMSNEVVSETPRVIIGVVLKCRDGHWEDRDGLKPPDPLLVMGTGKCLQCWQEQQPVETIIERPGEPLPDVRELNAKVPETEWEMGLDGKPRPPWALNWIVYLMNPTTGDTWTFINSTTGARIAYERLHDKFTWMRALRGKNVVPVVELDSRPMKTKFGTKMRPEFRIIEWRDLPGGDGGGVPQIAPPSAPDGEQIAKPQLEQKPEPAKKQAEINVGKKIQEPSLAEEMRDGIRY